MRAAEVRPFVLMRLLMATALAFLSGAARVVAQVVANPPIPVSEKAHDADAPIPAPQIRYEKYTLVNGLQVILAVDRRVPVVHLNLWYHVGSKDERPGRDGFAHLFEHMMYQGSKHADSNYGGLIEAAGGSTNADPDEDRTEYFETVPSGSLEYALWLESDRLATLPEAITQERLDNQKAVVRNERRQRLENEPYGLASVLLHENLYPVGHPYAHSVIGSHDDVQASTLADVKDFFATYYAPNNLSMAVAGDFDPAEVKRWIEKYFGPIPPAPPIARPARWTPRLQGEKIVDVNDHVAEERTYFAWIAPGRSSDDAVPLELAASLLNRRLSAELIYGAKPLCSEVSAQLVAHEDASEFVVMASARSVASLAEVERKVDAILADLAKAGPNDDELRQFKMKFEYGELSNVETLQSIARTLNDGNLLGGAPDAYERRWQRLETVTSAEIVDATRRWLATDDRLLTRFHPEPAEAQSGAVLDRSIVPPIHPDAPFRAPKVESATLPNGLLVLVAQRSGIPKVSVLLATRAGVMLDPPDKASLALLTASSLAMGSETRGGSQIRDAMESLGASKLESSVDTEGAGLGFEALSANLEPAFSILADVAQHPAFKQYSLDTNRRQFADGLAEARTSADDIAGNVVPALIFGADHPYARPTSTEAGLGRVGRDDLVEFYEKYWKPDDSALIFAGDISLAKAVDLAQKYLGAWSGSAPKPTAIPPPASNAAGRVYLIDRPDAPQTLIVQILPGVGAQSPERFPLSLATAVWGGMWGSRLSASLREKQGYTYGFEASMGLYSNYGCLVASGTVQTDKTKESVAELERQLRLLKDQPISEAEWGEAKKANLQATATGFETSGAVASRLAQLWTWGLPLSDVQGETDGAQAASLASVRAAVARYADPGKAILLLVGNRSKIEPGLRELKLGEITILDADGKPAGQTGR